MDIALGPGCPDSIENTSQSSPAVDETQHCDDHHLPVRDEQVVLVVIQIKGSADSSRSHEISTFSILLILNLCI